jgi:hypothetical protein
MAEKNGRKIEAEVADAAEVAAAPEESVYTARELAANARAVFGVCQDLAAAALGYAGIQTCTVNEAKQIIKNYAERKVV